MSPRDPATGHTSTGEQQLEGHYWERCRRTPAPLVVGALGLVALGIGQLVPVRHSAEADLRSRSLAALADAGLAGISVDVTGQDAVLTGTVASDAEARRALAIVGGLEGVREATSRLAPPGTTPSTTPTSGTPTSGTGSAGPSAEPSPASSTLPSLTPTGTPVTTPVVPPPPTAGLTEEAALQARLRTLPPIRFAYASSRLTPAGRASVARAAAVLTAASPHPTFRVDGYTDDVGDWDVNLALSRARAEAVRRVLIANGVPVTRVFAVGWSEEHPKVPNTSAANRAINRRAEIVVR
jgi:outer membrane protein OmpA-like peptidoglycan-associated protein